MNARTTWSVERFGLCALSVLMLSPLVLQGLWRPLAQVFQAEGSAVWLALAGILVSIVVVVTDGVARNHPSGRWLPAALGGLAALLLGFSQGTGIAGVAAASLALIGTAGFCSVLLPWLMRRLPADLDGQSTRYRGATALVILLGLAGATQTTRIAVFMGDSSRAGFSLVPGLPFLVHHSCLTAYVEGARLATDGVENLYHEDHWPDLSESPAADASADRYAPFQLDSFAYPPPFLLLPRLLLAPLRDFASQRAVWFAACGLFVAAGLFVVATWIGGRAGTLALLVAPLVFVSPATLVGLQTGNVHAAVVVSAMLALVAFERRRPALGGALLAFAVVAKLSPGLLVMVLLVQRRFREVLWTIAWGGLYTVLAFGVFGLDPFKAFLTYELPRLGSGEALRFLAGPESVPINLSPFGIPFKLALLGVDVGDPWAIARNISTVFTATIVALTAWAAWTRARVPSSPTDQAMLWAAVLTLAALRSPLAPGYIAVSLFWLLSLRAAEIRGRWGIFLMVLTWLSLSIPLAGSSSVELILSMCQQGLAVGIVFAVLRPASDASVPTGGSSGTTTASWVP